MKLPSQEQILRAKMRIQGSRLFTPSSVYRYTNEAQRNAMMDHLVHETLEVRDPGKVALGAYREEPTSEDVASYIRVVEQPFRGAYYLNGFDMATPMAALAFTGFNRFHKAEVAQRMIRDLGSSAVKLAGVMGVDPSEVPIVLLDPTQLQSTPTEPNHE